MDSCRRLKNQASLSNIILILATVKIRKTMHRRTTEFPVAIPSSMKKIKLGYIIIIIVTSFKSRTMIYMKLVLIIMCIN